jgi:3-deoxy-D-arabino-heptulosonate 7-phosphate (DAHP) synthase class II
MHGNTIKAPSGLKTRSFDSIRVILTWTCLFLLELVDSIRVMHGNTIKAPSRLMMYALPYYHPQDLSLFASRSI